MLQRLGQRLQSQNLRFSAIVPAPVPLSRQLRSAFADLVGQSAEAGYVPDAVFPAGDHSEIETIGEFLGRFVGCEEQLPARCRRSIEDAYLQCFGRVPGASRFATYASAARRIAELRRGRSGLAP